MTWTDITRAEHRRKTGFYPSDLTMEARISQADI